MQTKSPKVTILKSLEVSSPEITESRSVQAKGREETILEKPEVSGPETVESRRVHKQSLTIMILLLL